METISCHGDHKSLYDIIVVLTNNDNATAMETIHTLLYTFRL